MLERAHAMMVLQDLYLRQLNRALGAKEEKKKKGTDRRKILFADGYGRHMTNDKFITVLEEDKKTRKDNDVRAAKKRATREKKKARKVEVEAEWEKVKVAHTKAIAEWTLECNRQKKLGVKPKSLPPKPKRATKQSIEQGMDEYADLESSDAQDLTDKNQEEEDMSEEDGESFFGSDSDLD